MSKADISILVVDDARFSSAMINRVIALAGYTDVRHAPSAIVALKLIEERPAQILIADWLMPEIDGLELTQRVRQFDEASNHFTYVILLTAKEGVDAITTAFDQGVDDFVNKSSMNDMLPPRLYAAERMSSMQNRLLNDNQQLIEANARLRKLSTHDGLTGLGNRDYAVRRLDESIRHMSSRGGAACYLLLTIANFDDIRKQYPPAIISQLLVAVARRLRQLIRPLDVATRINPQQFAVIMQQPHIHNCNATSFKRIYDGVNLKAYKTSAGFISIRLALTVSASDNQLRPPNAVQLMDLAQSLVSEASDNARIVVGQWKQTEEVE